MSNKQQFSLKGTIAPVVSGVTQRTHVKLTNAVQTYAVLAVAKARLRILNNAATLLKNRGSLWAAFTEFGIDEAGTDTIKMDPRILRFLSEMYAPSTLNATRGALAVATYNLAEAAILWMSTPKGAQ